MRRQATRGVNGGWAMVLAAGLAVGLLPVATAAAAVPGALAHVAAETPVYVAVPNLKALLDDVTAFNKAFGKLLPEEAQQGMAGLGFAQLLLAQPGVKADGSAAVVLYLPAEGPEAGPPDGVAILPVEDFEAFRTSPFIESQNPTFADGVLSVNMFGTVLTMRDLGDYVAAGVNAERVRAYATQDQGAAHAAMLGAAGEAAASGNDLMLVANIPLLADQIRAAGGAIDQQAAMAAAMGAGEQIAPMVQAFKMVVENFARDGQAGILGLNIGASGVALDLASQFKPDSELAGFFADAGDSASLLGSVPEMPFLVAYSADMRSAGTRQLLNNAMALAPQMGEGGDKMQGTFAALMQNTDGIGGVIGMSQAMGGAGLLANQVQFTRTTEPAAMQKAFRDLLTGLNGTAAQGVVYKTDYAAGAADVAGMKVDTYAVTTTLDENAPPAGFGAMADPAMVNQILYGVAGGPNGFVAATEGGVYTTSSKNSELLGKAIAAGKGQGRLDGAALLKSVAERLPAKRSAEAYISASNILNAVGPFAQMMGAMEKFEPVAELPPVGVAAAPGDGGVTFRLVVPGEVIAKIAELQAQAEGPAMEEGGDAPDKPKF